MQKILIGKVVAAFGIKGEVKIVSHCQNPIDIAKYNLFDDKNGSIKLKISNKNSAIVGSGSDGGVILIAKINGIDERNKAEDLRGTQIFIDRKDFAKTKKDEFYHADLIGLTIIDENSQQIGKVKSVNDYGAGGMIEIEFANLEQKKRLDDIADFPFTNEIFPEVNIGEGFIRMTVPEFSNGLYNEAVS
jgi:16S rRNA processing protein RimM